MRFVFNCSSKLDCKEQNGYTTNIKPDIGAVGSVGGWGGPGSAPVRPAVCTPDMTRYTPSSVDQVARDRAWMNTCSSLSAAAQELNQHQQTALNSQKYPISCLTSDTQLFDDVEDDVQATQSPPQLQQPSAHQTFYPWMAIAGRRTPAWGERNV